MKMVQRNSHNEQIVYSKKNYRYTKLQSPNRKIGPIGVDNVNYENVVTTLLPLYSPPNLLLIF